MASGLYIGEQSIGMVRVGTFTSDGSIDTSDATATANDILSGKTAYSKGSKVTGSIASQAAQTITPGTSDQTIAAGKYLSGAQTIKGDVNLVPANIVSGKTIFGVSGSYSASTGLDTSDATATASDMLSGKTAYVNGTKITGSIKTKSSTDLTADGKTVTVPSGYYSASATKDIDTATHSAPTISVDSSGKITATHVQSAGYTSGGTTTATKQLTTQAAKTITPGTSDQTIASATYLTGVQTIKGDANLIAGNIKSGVSIFGVAGNYAGGSSSGSSMIMKSGTTTSTTINTGLSNISVIVIYKDSFTATGLIQGIYITDEDTLHYTYCSLYSYFQKQCATSTSTASSVSGGTFTLGTSGTSGLSSSTTYNWVAFGTE